MLNKYKYYILTLILAISSISYELLLSNTLSFLTGQQVVYQTLSIGIFILGLGVGSYVSDYYNKDSLKTIQIIEILLITFGFFSISYIFSITMNYKFYEFFLLLKSDNKSVKLVSNLKLLFTLAAESIVFILGFLSGFEVPLIMKLAGKNENKILGLNYIGTLIGTLIFTYFFNTRFHANQIAMILALLNTIAVMLILEKRLYKILLSLLFIVYLSINFFNFKTIEMDYYTLSYAFYNLNVNDDYDTAIANIPKYPQVTRINSLYQKIDIVQSSNNLTFYLDTNFQFSEKTERFYHQGFAHVPIILNKKIPEKVLILGAGDGLLLRELIKYPEIKSITQIELDQTMINLAKSYDYLKTMNKDSLSDPRLNLIIGDGFYYARTSNDKYDAIYIDFPYPKNNDLAKLYSVEFYSFVKRLLKDDNSYIVLDVPLVDNKDKTIRDGFYDIYREYNDVLFSSFSFAGFETLQPYRIDSETFMFLKVKKEKIDIDNIKSNMFSPSVQFKVDQINSQVYDYKIDKKFINSVFKPKLME